MHKIYLPLLYMFHIVSSHKLVGTFQSEKKHTVPGPSLACRAVQNSLDVLLSPFPASQVLRAHHTQTSVRALLHANPHNAHHNIHPLALSALILETPHAITLIVPVRAARAVHAATAHAPHFARFLCFRLGFAACAPGLAQVLDDCAVDGEFIAVAVGRVRVAGGRGFGDEGLQDGVDDGVVPACGAVVLVGCGG